MSQLACVIPTVRPERFKAWLKVWQPIFDRHGAVVYVVEDSDVKSSFGLKNHWCRKDVPDFVPTHTGSIRSYGFMMAYKDGCDVITLDDDCLPAEVDIIQEFNDGFANHYPVGDYFDVGNSFGLNEFMRGYPFEQRHNNTPLLQYGGWDNIPDMDAITQMAHEKDPLREFGGYRFDRKVQAIPIGLGFTGCIMNLAIKHEAIPMMYQLIMGLDRVGYDRWDDIWSGLFAKRICDHLKRPILINGKASIIHTRASDTQDNLKKEQGGYELNEHLWGHLQKMTFEGTTPLECYAELIPQLDSQWFGPQGHKIITGMSKWLAALS